MVKFNLIVDLLGADVFDLKLTKEFSFPVLPRQGETIFVGKFVFTVKSIEYSLEDQKIYVFCDLDSSHGAILVVNSPGGWSFDGSDEEASKKLLSEMRSLGVALLPEWCD